MSFQVHQIPFFGEVISSKAVQPILKKVCILTEIPSYNKKVIAIICRLMNYMGKMSLKTTYVSHCGSWHQQNVNGSWTAYTELVWQVQIYYQEECGFGALQWKTTATAINRCIESQSMRKPSTRQGWNEIFWNDFQSQISLHSHLKKE